MAELKSNLMYRITTNDNNTVFSMKKLENKTGHSSWSSSIQKSKITTDIWQLKTTSIEVNTPNC